MRRRRRAKRKGGGRHVGIRDGPGYLRKCSDSPPSRDGKGREPAMASYSYGMCSVLCALCLPAGELGELDEFHWSRRGRSGGGQT